MKSCAGGGRELQGINTETFAHIFVGETKGRLVWLQQVAALTLHDAFPGC
jgi:hypothetical protein